MCLVNNLYCYLTLVIGMGNYPMVTQIHCLALQTFWGKWKRIDEASIPYQDYLACCFTSHERWENQSCKANGLMQIEIIWSKPKDLDRRIR